jgi:molybdate transport system substrate-binding protein
MRNRGVGLAAAVIGASILLLAAAARSEEIKVLASAAVKEAYLELVPQFEKASGHRVVTTWSGTADIMKRIKAGENPDLVIVAANSLEELTQLGRITPGSRVDLAKSGVGVAVRAGAPRPDISSGEALKRALLSAKSIGYSSGPSGVYIASLFQRWGITEELKPRIKQVAPGVNVGELIAKGEADIGFQQVSELLPVQGIQFLGPLPPDIQITTVFSGGIPVGAKDPAGAKALVKFLTAPAAAPVIRKKGMEPG